MSTFYKAVKKLSDEQKKKIHEALDNDEYDVVDKLLTYSDGIEIGHRAGGWKFTWYPFNDELKALTKNAIIDYVMSNNIVIYDEYGEKQDKVEFLEMAFNWDKNGWDSLSYYKEHPDETKYSCSYRQARCNKILNSMGFPEVIFKNEYQSDFESDGLRWTILQ